jgi:hypothetical protein
MDSAPGYGRPSPGLDISTRKRAKMNVLTLILLLLGVMLYCPARGLSGEGEERAIDCAIESGPCTKSLGDGTLTLDITPKPVKAMHDLTFTVALSGLTPTIDPFIDLGMPGMVMGPNRVPLGRAGDGTYQGTGVIVRCPSGRRTWKATVTIPGKGAVEFVFDVVY